MKGNKNVSEEIDEIIAHIAEVNNLREFIDNVHFNDDEMLGKDKEMIDKLSDLVAVFHPKIGIQFLLGAYFLVLVDFNN